MNILAVGSHLDDLELGAGGTLAKFAENNKVIVVITSNSEYTDYNNNILRSKKCAIEEGIKALNALGIYCIDSLNYKTKQVPYNYQIIEEINKFIDLYNIDLIITHHLSDSHQDHYNTVKSVLAAGRRCKNIWMMEALYPSNLSNQGFNPTLYVDISDTIDLKIKSIKAHKSQLNKYGNNWIDLVKSRARVRGLEIGVNYGEAFEVIKQAFKI